MALPGFELLYSGVVQQIRSSDDAAIVVVHWNVISNGLKCYGVGDVWLENEDDNQSGSETLPSGWNTDRNIYAFRYIDQKSDKKFLMKALAVDGSLIVHMMSCSDEKTVSTTFRSEDYVNADRSSVERAYTNLKELNDILSHELWNKLVKISSAQNASRLSSKREEQPGMSPLVEDPRRGYGSGGLGYTPPRQPFRADINDPFSVGRADLDPLSGGIGGGMFMDPRSFPMPGGFQPGPFRPNHQGFPPGSVPPGARFDPVGPPGVRQQPDPDHERPPDNYDDMFM